MQIGVISDTHGLLRPEALEALQGADLIIHAGDIGQPQILQSLQNLAPVFAIRGNVDTESWYQEFPLTEVIEAEGFFFYIIHNIDELDLNPVAAGFHVVIYGHSHRPEIDYRNGVLYLNPGSAGRRRFDLPISLARINVTENKLTPEIIHLEV